MLAHRGEVFRTSTCTNGFRFYGTAAEVDWADHKFHVSEGSLFDSHFPEKELLDVYKMDFDIIHGHGGGTISLLGLEIAKIKKIPFIFTYHTLFSKYVHYILKGLIIRPKMIEALSRFLMGIF